MVQNHPTIKLWFC